MGLDRLVGIFGVLFVVALMLRIFLVKQQIGRWPVIFKHADAAHEFVHKVLFTIIMCCALNVVLFRLQAVTASATLQSAYRFLGPLDALQGPIVQTIGLILAYGGLIWSVVAQAQMGKDWRAGIDADNTLVQRGLYSISRHPIYIGFMAIAFGLFLAVPNVLSLFCAVLTFIMLSIEARLEEQFLIARDGEPYRAYLKRTRRWI